MSTIESKPKIKTKANQHIHQYERSRANKDIYRCVHPDCSYYQSRIFLAGKRALCPKCKNNFILDWKQLKNRTPKCEFCRNSFRSEALRLARDTAFRALNDLPEEFKAELLKDTLE